MIERKINENFYHLTNFYEIKYYLMRFFFFLLFRDIISENIYRGKLKLFDNFVKKLPRFIETIKRV